MRLGDLLPLLGPHLTSCGIFIKQGTERIYLSHWIEIFDADRKTAIAEAALRLMEIVPRGTE